MMESPQRGNNKGDIASREKCNTNSSKEDGISKTMEPQNITFREKLSDSVYKEKLFASIMLCYVFFSGGWIMGQKGPSFLDVLQMTNTSTVAGSAYFTALFVGIGVGSLVTGPLIDRFNNSLILLCGVIVASVSSFIMPWCTLYWSMVLVNIVQGFGLGSLATASLAIMAKIWGVDKDGRAFMQAVNFTFALASVLSPLALKPYLIQKSHTMFTSTNNSYVVSSTTYIPPDDNENIENKLYIPFSISGAVMFVGIVPLLYEIWKQQKNKTMKDLTVDTSSSEIHKSNDIGGNDGIGRTQSVQITILCTVLIGVLMLFYYAGETSFTSYLATFAVEGLQWSKDSGSDLTSAFWAALAASRFIGIFASHLLRPAFMIGVCCFANLLFTFGIYFGAIYSNDITVWIFVAVSGISMSFVFPSIFSWTQEDITPVSGKISAYLQIIVCVSGSTSPLIFGYYMKDFESIYFLYLRFFLCGSALLIFIILFVVLKMCKK